MNPLYTDAEQSNVMCLSGGYISHTEMILLVSSMGKCMARYHILYVMSGSCSKQKKHESSI
jgi:hypothetical protein